MASHHAAAGAPVNGGASSSDGSYNFNFKADFDLPGVAYSDSESFSFRAPSWGSRDKVRAGHAAGNHNASHRVTVACLCVH